MARKRSTKKRKRSPESIVLHDSEGRPRVMIGIFGDGDGYPTFQLMDAEGRSRVVIQVGPTGRATFSLQEASGSGLIGIGADPDGDGRIGFSLTRPGGIPVLSVGWSEAEGLTTSFWGHDGKPTWQGFEPGPAVRESERRRAAKAQDAEPHAAADGPRL
ncbi:hypothetical protein J0H58_37740 [bacterium]|nr:hypothetical protein [bacterium]